MAINSMSQIASLAARQMQQANKATKITQANPGAAASDFGKILADGVAEANATVKAGDAAVDNMVRSGGGNLHEAMIALDKAEIATRLTVKVGQKLVNAYREVSQINV
jgi:flagellar hook-basal body complex protein FliE